MSATNSLESKFLSLYFTNANAANIGDATGLRGSTTAGSLYISLHTADPGEAPGTEQTTSESAYTNYARQAVVRSGSGWTISGTAPTQSANAAAINFPACGVTGSTVTNFGIGSATSGTGSLDFKGASALAVAAGITPSFAISALVVTLD